ncbi:MULTISPECIES: YncE family protein [unclassified Burkholderia]|uniref:YncE family protein n=1 Tax=unclassified Burkholderia TaxID=2613784 RepID=UPI000F58E353|nr:MULTISPECIES: hypothetical protein [unclassified Burkholderia]RQR35840.1 hypothetical protein DIE20_27230 [Burkholderia sp. Bp9131]RQR68996.1 hypothetical protein DIE12_24230 [Burkholderia sp. Bp9015]RQS04265.1 hypothetical protein DIE02_18465 [Burkholderia sp. Bp8991]RQS29779.1 hypothetical protein DIE05_12285 [Burkholderia sp. Bp8995]RQS47875.1 hypothetical protein DIE00_12865 [Burkholderia sp. Bp8989]
MKRTCIALAMMSLTAAAAIAWGADAGGPKLITTIPVTSEKSFGFDISAVSDGNYYLADGANGTLDVFDATTMKLRDRIKADFAGIGPTHEKSGPSGVLPIPGTSQVYVGDVNAVKVIDVASKQLVKRIEVSASGIRADEGCLDPKHHVAMFSSGAEQPPFVTFINTETQSVIAKMPLADSTGLEACEFDAKNDNFVLNNDGTKANPKGEVDLIPAKSVLEGKPVVQSVFKLKGCEGPTGIALGPGNDALIGCDPDEGGKQTTVIIDRTNGTPLAQLPFGGADEVAYDPVSNRYFLAAGHHSADNVSRVGAKDAKFDSALGIVDASTRSLVAIVPTGKFSHSVAVDGASHHVFVPYGAGSSEQFPGTGVAVFATE